MKSLVSVCLVHLQSVCWLWAALYDSNALREAPQKMHSKQQTPSSSNTTVVPPNCAHDAAHQTPVKGKNDGTYEVFVLAFFPDGALRGPLCMWGVLKRDENGDRSVRGELIDADVARLSLPLPV